MKKEVQVFCLLLLILNCSGVYLHFLLQKSIHKQIVKNIILEDPMVPKVKILLDPLLEEKIHWIDRNEFVLEAQMFDVLFSGLDECGRKYLICYQDNEESQIIKEYSNLSNSEPPTNSTAFSTFVKCLDHSIYQLPTVAEIIIISKNTSVLTFGYIRSISSHYIEINHPPPNHGIS